MLAVGRRLLARLRRLARNSAPSLRRDRYVLDDVPEEEPVPQSAVVSIPRVEQEPRLVAIAHVPRLLLATPQGHPHERAPSKGVDHRRRFLVPLLRIGLGFPPGSFFAQVLLLSSWLFVHPPRYRMGETAGLECPDLRDPTRGCVRAWSFRWRAVVHHRAARGNSCELCPKGGLIGDLELFWNHRAVR